MSGPVDVDPERFRAIAQLLTEYRRRRPRAVVA